MHYFATLFDYNYLSRGLCLLDSMNKVMPDDYKIFILALDQNTITYFRKKQSPNITILTIKEIEEFYPELIPARANRSLVEYYFTLSPILPLYILENFNYCERITTLDADIYFYSSPSEIFKKYNKEAILITPHDFAPQLSDLLVYGTYNVSFQSFPQTINGISLLKDWKKRCLIWCMDSLDKDTGYFADQKYLDDWKDNFENVHSIDLKNCGRAPWNILNEKITFNNKTICINNEPLVYYHFHGLRINGKYINHGLEMYQINHLSFLLRSIYSKYILNLYILNKAIGKLEDSTVIRHRSNLKSSKFIDFIQHYKIGAIVLVSKKVLFYNIKQLNSKLKINPFFKTILIGRTTKP